MAITTPPAAPNRSNPPATFSLAVDDFLAWLVLSVPDFNALSLVTNSSLWADGTAASPGMRFTSDTNTGFFRPGVDIIGFSTGGLEAGRFDASQNLLLGNTAQTTGLPVSRLSIEGVGALGGMNLTRFNANANAPIFSIGKSRSAAVGGYAIVVAADQLGSIEFNGSDGSAMVLAARIQSYTIGTPAAGDIRGALRFFTGSGAGAVTNRLTIDDTTIAATLPISTSGSVLSTGSGGIGYGVGAGGLVTQATSKTTAVTLNETSGRITTNAAALAAATSVEFTFNNSEIGIEDLVNIEVQSPVSKYTAAIVGKTAGTCIIRLTNYTAGSLSEAVLMNFGVGKVSTT